MIIVSLIGKPGAGKSTLAHTLSATYGWPIISTGQIARDLAAQNVISDNFLSGGGLANEAMIREAVAERFQDLKQFEVVVIEGMPRNPGQASFLARLGDVLFVTIDIGDQVAADRLKSRRRPDDVLGTIEARMELYARSQGRIDLFCRKSGRCVSVDAECGADIISPIIHYHVSVMTP